MKKAAFTILLMFGLTLSLHAQDYVLGVNDSVEITVHQHPDLDTKTRIEDSGNINFPLLGAVKIGGMSVKDAGRRIEDALKAGGFIKSPQVSLFVDEFKSNNVSVLGNINKPGQYQILGNSTVLGVIAEAGGIAKDGSPRVVITRKGQEPFVVDISLAMQGDIKQNVNLQNDDFVFVPRMDVFYIYGEVNKPGEYQLHDDMTILHALSVGGGLTDKGTERGLKIKRKSPDGEVQTINADAIEVLMPNDVVYVKESLF